MVLVLVMAAVKFRDLGFGSGGILRPYPVVPRCCRPTKAPYDAPCQIAGRSFRKQDC